MNRDSKEHLIAEYESLREEIKNNSQIIAQTFTVSITAVAIILGYGIQTQNTIVFLSSFAILIPTLWFISSQLESTVRAATYVKVCIEPKSDFLNWESMLFKLRKIGRAPGRKYAVSISSIYLLLGFISIFLSWLFLKNITYISLTFLTITSAVCLIGLFYSTKNLSRYFGLDFFEQYVKLWREICENSSLREGEK